jgi:hypothetical protein
MLRTEFELEGDETMLDGLERVRIKRNNAIGEAVLAGTIGAMLLTDLALLLVQNDSGLPFDASDAPLVAHNRLFEATRSVRTAGYANVGLQLYLPLGPRLLLLCHDPAAYAPVDAEAGFVCFNDRATARLLNHLQREAAGKVILTSPAMDEAELRSAATRW